MKSVSKESTTLRQTTETDSLDLLYYSSWDNIDPINEIRWSVEHAIHSDVAQLLIFVVDFGICERNTIEPIVYASIYLKFVRIYRITARVRTRMNNIFFFVL